MSAQPANRFVERSRLGRRAELSRLGQDRKADLSMILSLSLGIKGRQAHVDYVGGLDITKVAEDIASSLKNFDLQSKIPTIQILEPAEVVENQPALPSLRDALLDAAPVDVQQGLQESRDARRNDQERRRHDFVNTLSQFDTKALLLLAHEHHESQRRQTANHRPSPLPLPKISKPVFGSAHVFYMLQFDDEQTMQTTKWVAKIPVHGTAASWDDLSSETLRAEAGVLKLLSAAGLPVPKLICADWTCDNDVHVPYLIMEYVEGKKAVDVWFDGGKQPGARHEKVLQEKRRRILEGVASTMLKLGKFEFEQGGLPIFDEAGALLSQAAPMRELDTQRMIARWFADEECGSLALYARVGPFGDPAHMYTAMLDMPLHADPDESADGVDGLLRLLIEQVREPVERHRWSARDGGGAGKKKKPFVLTHPDLSLRNIIVDEDGSVKAILGWDSVRAAPRSMGNEAFPRWLVRDYNPFLWRWRPAPDFWRRGHKAPEENRFEDPPWVLRELRETYVKILGKLKAEESARPTRLSQLGRSDGSDGSRREDAEGKEGPSAGRSWKRDNDVADAGGLNITMQSLLTLSLDAAVRDPRCRVAVLRRILEKCSPAYEELSFDGIVEKLGRGEELDGYRLMRLQRSVRELGSRGFVKGAVVW
ncbi:hypothetical protein F4778DRAFT_402501 [Xylariomycetidae sp. FL2044]|nr:hypothetical protein F4778DRAFT_402501 [Xylariomycetidae sp. FL2044]